ncbi:MAG: hypothetical protein F6J96_21305 [Symploca sp. SIO1C2]|nr:hypothetical protein [Symploca sp. SIO1C2]
MNGIIYPTLDLFLYDLRNSVGAAQEELQTNRDFFLKKLPEDLHEVLFQQDTVFEDDYLELLPKIKEFQTSGEPYPFQGYYYPVRLNDLYGLLLDCSINNQTEAQPTASFKELKAEIEERLNHQNATIGQTWMISGWLPQPNPNPPEKIAQACYKALMPGSNWERDLEGQGQFLGATIFELSHYRLLIPEETASPTTIQSVQENQHVIIILYPDRATAEKSAQFYHHWLRLFSYRHKILWAYARSQFLKRTMKNRSTDLAQHRQSISQNQTNYRENKLRDTLVRAQDSIKNYTIELYQLEFQGGIIEINLSNYEKRLGTINERSQAIVADNLSCFDKFIKLVTDKYLLQIAKDAENLKRILKLQEDTINVVRSRVEVEKAQRDCNFQDAIAILGVGWSVASLVPSKDESSQTNVTCKVSSKDESSQINITCQPSVSENKSIIPEVAYKLSVAIVAAALTWLLIRLWPGFRRLIPLIPKKEK